MCNLVRVLVSLGVAVAGLLSNRGHFQLTLTIVCTMYISQLVGTYLANIHNKSSRLSFSALFAICGRRGVGGGGGG